MKALTLRGIHPLRNLFGEQSDHPSIGGGRANKLVCELRRLCCRSGESLSRKAGTSRRQERARGRRAVIQEGAPAGSESGPRSISISSSGV